MNTIITLTDAAENHIQSMMTKNNNAKGFRLSLKKTGCSGYAYVPAIVEETNEKDIHFVTANGLPVYVDSTCLDFLKDCVVDYIDDGNIGGLKQKRLVFINPREKNRCGCGESFTIE